MRRWRRSRRSASRLGDDASSEVIGQGVRARRRHRARARAYPLRRHRHRAGGAGLFGIPASRAARTSRRRSLAKMKSAFEAAHKSRFGFIDESKELVVEAVSVEAIGGGAKFTEPVLPTTGDAACPRPTRRTRFFSRGQWHDGRGLYARRSLRPATPCDGPAIVIEPHQTIVVEDGWRAAITAKNHLVLERAVPLKRQRAIGTDADPVMLEVFNNLFMSIAEQMGVSLQNTAYSVNIKERLDFSCAVFDADGTLVANAPHMPVHLGSMDRAVETIIRENKGRIAPGDVYAINAPYNGGTHLPDITVCTPVFDEAGREILFWVASRGHHADVGGISPGSMSPHATTIEEEGVYIDNFKLVDRGRFREQRALRPPHRREISRAQPAAERQRPEGADRRQREGRAGAAQDGRAFHPAGGARPTCSTCRTTPPRACAASSTGCTTAAFAYEMDQGTVIKVQDHRRQGEARGDRRFHRHLAAAARPISTRPSR